MMLFRVHIIFCIIAVTWTSASGQTTNTTLSGYWLREIKKCASGGGAIWIYTDKIRNGPTDALPFDSSHVDSTVKVEGAFELWLGTKSLSVSYDELHLPYFKTFNDTLYFQGGLNEESHGLIVTQKATIGIKLGIHRNGDYTLENMAWAYSDMALSCASAKSLILTISVIN